MLGGLGMTKRLRGSGLRCGIEAASSASRCLALSYRICERALWRIRVAGLSCRPRVTPFHAASSKGLRMATSGRYRNATTTLGRSRRRERPGPVVSQPPPDVAGPPNDVGSDEQQPVTHQPQLNMYEFRFVGQQVGAHPGEPVGVDRRELAPRGVDVQQLGRVHPETTRLAGASASVADQALSPTDRSARPLVLQPDPQVPPAAFGRPFRTRTLLRHGILASHSPVPSSVGSGLNNAVQHSPHDRRRHDPAAQQGSHARLFEV